MKKTLILLSFSATVCVAQNSVNSQGQSISNGSYIFDNSLGETASLTLSSPQNVFTQGFNQPVYYTTVVKQEDPGLSFVIFPNPVADEIQITTPKGITPSYSVVLCDLQGKFIEEADNARVMDLRKLSAGTYMITITEMGNKKTNTYKIIKK